MPKVSEWIDDFMGREPGMFGPVKKQVACRLEFDSYILLSLVAKKMEISPTRCAEGLLEAAISEAAEHMDVKPLPGENDPEYEQMSKQVLADILKARGFKIVEDKDGSLGAKGEKVALAPGVLEALKEAKD